LYLVDKLGPLDKVKLTKLLYIADRSHFLKNGRPITGDRQYALRFGPLASNCLDALNGMLCTQDRDLVFEFLHVDNKKVLLEKKPDTEILRQSEIDALNEAVESFGQMGTFELADYTHSFPEYVEVYEEGTSKRIPYELMLKHHGNKEQVRFGRPVVTAEIAQHAVNPFSSDDSDL
jgi:uncharacterized phage-associated protein